MTYLAWALRGCGVLLLGASAFAQALVNGGVVRGSISAAGEQDTYTFSGARGDWFELRLVDVNGSSFTPQLDVYNPRGALISTNQSPDVAVIDTIKVEGFSLSTPVGTYTVVVSNPSTTTPTGDYDLHFVLVPGANAGGELLDGVTTIGEIEVGELDSFTFGVAAGQTFLLTVTPLYDGTLRLRAEEFDGRGGHAEGIGGTFQLTSTSSTAGIHTLVVSDGHSAATGTGHYSIVVQGVPAPAPYPPSVFWPSEFRSDPLLLDNGGHSGLGPRIGDPAQPFNASIDCTAADSPSAYALALSTGHSAAVSIPWGSLYLSGSRLLQKLGQHQQSIETWFPVPTGLAVPNNLSLVGMSYTFQGVCGGFAGSLRMSGAITQTIGN